MHRRSVRSPLRPRELLLPGQDSGGYPRDEPHRRSVHRLHVLPEEVSFKERTAAATAAADAFYS